MVFPVFLFLVGSLSAQGFNGPLSIQGLDRQTLHSASARAMGGVTIGVSNDASSMFQNPAGLFTLESPQISLGGLRLSSDMKQEQHYAPVRYYSNFSLLMEGLTHLIPDPDSLLGGAGPRDTVQRPYDNIGPNWSRSKNRTIPLQGMFAVPFSFGDFKFVAGAGVVEYADLNHFYQNNNVLSPALFSQRPLPTFRPTDDAPVTTEWFQYVRSREGTIRGYGAAFSATLPKHNISIGVSGMILSGNSDDFEQQLGRGRLTFYSNAFRLDSLHKQITGTGTSDYTGEEFTLSGMYEGRYIRVGIAAKPPTRIRRTYTMNVETDTTGITSTAFVSGRDRIRLPWRGTIALLLKPKESLRLGLEYELRPYAQAVYKSVDGSESSPWLSTSIVRVGVEYEPLAWLTLRGGIRGQSEVFEQEGNPIPGDPVIRFDLTYEYVMAKYQDIWGSAVILNSDRRHAIVAHVTYELPSLW
jgi:hypothetical protein